MQLKNGQKELLRILQELQKEMIEIKLRLFQLELVMLL